MSQHASSLWHLDQVLLDQVLLEQVQLDPDLLLTGVMKDVSRHMSNRGNMGQITEPSHGTRAAESF